MPPLAPKTDAVSVPFWQVAGTGSSVARAAFVWSSVVPLVPVEAPEIGPK